MRRFLCALRVLFPLMLVSAISTQAESATDLPSPFDNERDLIGRYWAWLKAELDAPPDLPWPKIYVEPLPHTVSMAFVFPTLDEPWRKTRIVISPRAIDRANGSERLVTVGELAHEMVHYIMVLSENGWDFDAEILRNEVHHHCDKEFMRLTQKIVDFIWEIYHSNDAIRSISHMVQLACWRDGHAVGTFGRR